MNDSNNFQTVKRKENSVNGLIMKFQADVPAYTLVIYNILYYLATHIRHSHRAERKQPFEINVRYGHILCETTNCSFNGLPHRIVKNSNHQYGKKNPLIQCLYRTTTVYISFIWRRRDMEPRSAWRGIWWRDCFLTGEFTSLKASDAEHC